MVQYEITNHLGNVQAVINDKKLAVEEEDIVTYHSGIIFATDYYPFGMTMPERALNTPDYRYGFNGQEKDDEVSGSGNSYTAEFWQYDSRLGRRWNLDPKPNPSMSIYATFVNNPILYFDILGDTIGLIESKDYDIQDNPIYTYGKVSDRMQVVLKDAMKTKEAREYFGKFAVKGQTLGGYTFQENGEFSNHYITIQDFSLSDFDWVRRSVPMTNEGTYISRISSKGSHIQAYIQIMSFADNSKHSLAETFAHETFLHGTPRIQEFMEFEKGGENAYLKQKAKDPRGDIDHAALKNRDAKHIGYKSYQNFMTQLGDIDKEYLKYLNKVHKH